MTGSKGSSQVIVRDATEEDLPFMNEVYNYNALYTTAVFFTSPVSDEYRLNWFMSLSDPNTGRRLYPCLLGVRKDENGEEVKLGYVCYLPWLPGAQFQHLTKIKMYISQKYTGTGLGAIFLNAILDHPLAQRFKVIIAAITTENIPSVKFFSKCNFVYSGQLDNVGFKFDRWLGDAYYTLYLPMPTPVRSEREISSGDPPLSKTELSGIVCRDVGEDDLATLDESGFHLTVNSFELPAAMEDRRAWFLSLSSKPDLLCPAILAQDPDTKTLMGHAYLKPISDKPGYRFSVELHLVVHNSSAVDGLLDAILGDQRTRAFRLITATIISGELGIEEKLSKRGFRQAVVCRQVVREGDAWKDLLIYTLDTNRQVVT